MYSDWVVLLGLAVVAVFIWLTVLTFLVWQQGIFLRSLFPKSGERDIRKKFEETLKQVLDFRQDLDQIKSKADEIERTGLKHIQRVSLSRFNPYEDTGGDQSFTLALLNSKGDGFVITSLHARSGTRVFAKPVTGLKADKYQFSKEEIEVIKEAMENKTI